MKYLKKLTVFLLALSLVLGLLPALGPAANAAGVTVNEANFPDAKFRSFVSSKYDVDSNGVLSDSERSTIAMDCSGRNIASLTGIEYFTGLKRLNCSDNALTALDVRQNSALTQLLCDKNQLSSLDVTKNTRLEILSCQKNQLSALDMSANSALTRLDCFENDLTKLDVSHNSELTWLQCYSNSLTELNLGKNSKLSRLYVHNNHLNKLDISGTPILKNTLANGTLSTSNSYNIYKLDDSILTVDKDIPIQTVRSYPLKVRGLEVTDENRSDILGDGVFSFDGISTLTVKGDCNTNQFCIENVGVKGLRIKVLQNSTLSSSAANVILARADTVITGPGILTLNCTQSDGSGIYAVNSGVVLTLELAQVDVKAYYGIVGPNGGNQAKLFLDHSYVLVRGADGGAICDFRGGITLRNCRISRPKNGGLNSSGSNVVDSEGKTAVNAYIVPTKRTNPFVDVQESDSFYDAVLWAYYHYPCQITAGKDETHFAPADTVTRAQAMTFLWKAADKPEPANSQNPFTDIKPGKYYYNPILWAYYYEPQITTGTSDTTYSPQKTCTRAQIITFLWNAMGRPVPKISNPYSDVSNKYYYTPALWAYEAGIEKGSGGKFNPHTKCTRASTVLYLYRFYTGRDLL